MRAKAMGNVVESDYFHCLYMRLLLHQTAEGNIALSTALHLVDSSTVYLFCRLFSYMISSKHIMHSFSKKKKKLSPSIVVT